MLSSAARNSSALSSRAKRGICFCGILAGLFLSASSSPQNPPRRSAILGIGSVSISVSSPRGAIAFYDRQLGFGPSGEMCAGACTLLVGVNPHQNINLLLGQQFDFATQKPSENNLVQVLFETSDVEALHQYLGQQGIRRGDIFHWGPNSAYLQFSLDDPDGHHIGFIQFNGQGPALYRPSPNEISSRIIHAGFVVRDRAAEDRFYKDILGFHVYWHGGMKVDQTDWVDMQVPDGTDWLEYMLNVPANADHHALGVMNHIALGVPDIHAAEAQLRKNGWSGNEQPKIGRDGKWQLNLYDPDDTRVEFMEFTPVQKPCCSEYTGPHPKP
jgi:catechol 2,3-dioxygenase-like lactoylglutathione lyase family enzyme